MVEGGLHTCLSPEDVGLNPGLDKDSIELTCESACHMLSHPMPVWCGIRLNPLTFLGVFALW